MQHIVFSETAAERPESAGAFGAQTLVELLSMRARQHPGRRAYTFLADGEGEEVSLTYGELERQARAVGAALQSAGAEGGRVLLLYPSGLEYVAAFFGCLYAGAVAVPVYSPRANRTLSRLQGIAADAAPKVALTTSTILSRMDDAGRRVLEPGGGRWVATDAIDADSAARWREPEVGGDTLALLQYTSGSTSAPKGVMVSHANLLHNERMIQRAFGQTEQSVIVSWLPLYHDMGLIGGVLQPLYLGAECVLMSPASFLQRPLRWPEAISRYRATTSGGPDFAYGLCVAKSSEEERAALDLSSWGVAFNGSEPVRAETLEQFASAFAPCGFRREAFQPCYGLAEATLFVSGGKGSALPTVRAFQPDALEKNRAVEVREGGGPARALVSSGRALPEARVVVVDPEERAECAPGQVGEIWVAGSSVAAGYWNRPEETERTFGARTTEAGAGPFLRTGDLGFLHEGELFVTGRLKDLIIIRGLNYYPQDIELTVERSHAALRPHGSAALSVEAAGRERLVVVAEVKRHSRGDAPAVFESIRRAVGEQHELTPHAVVLIAQGALPKTSSGKVRRQACKEAFLRGELKAEAEWREPEREEVSGEPPAAPAAPADDREGLERWLASRLAAKLGIDAAAFDTRRSLSSYGLDSLAAVELMHGVETGLGARLPVNVLLESSTVSELAGRLLEELRREGRAAVPLADAPGVVEGGTRGEAGAAEYPLSRGQEALWFLHKLAPLSPAYNIASAVRVRSGLDAGALRRAFQTLVDRHPALRTEFGGERGEVFQRVRARAEVCFQETDASSWTESALGERLTEEAHRPFDLERELPLRVGLFTRSPREHVILLAAHHIVTDFWSIAILMDELGRLYAAHKAGVEHALPEPPARYADYVRWQSSMLGGAEGEAHWGYWNRELGGELPVLNLPTSHPRPPVQTYSGASVPFRLDARLSGAVRALARGQGATLYVTLLAAFESLLRHYTRQTDFLVGSPSAGRPRADFAGVVGYFVNPLVLRARLSDDPTFEELIGRVRANVLEALAHQDYPFPLLVERLQPARDASRAPLFQVMFTLQKAPAFCDPKCALLAAGGGGARIELHGLELETVEFEQQIAQFDLTLMVAESGEELVGSWQYNTDLFERDAVERLSGHFLNLLEAAAAEPSLRISRLPLLGPPERRRVLRDFNRTGRAYAAGDSLHGLVERQARLTPDAPALVAGSERVSYAELNARANRLARVLRERGVGRESLVGVLMERDAWMVTALLAVLKAGAAYVPLDGSYPPERLAFMLEDAGVEVLIAQGRLLDDLNEGAARVIRVEELEGLTARERGEDLNIEAGGDDLAYVIYTSGSTGRPKGAMNTHRGICNRLLWMQETYGLTPSDRVLQKTPFSFDVSVWEFFWPLMTGATLVMARPGGHRDAAYLARVIAEEQVTTLHFVPSMLSVFLEEPGVESCASLRQVMSSGEALTAELAERFHARLGARLHNLYGPTEAAVDVTFRECPPGERGRLVPIGRPVANTQVYVVDEHLQPVPVGVPGELCIGGVQLARGYLNRPALTAERFVPDPFSEEPGARLYRTGDLVRHLPDGEIQYLGRLDHQVKIRGFRVELEEIESALLQHEGVKETLVTLLSDESGGRLVAYVVGSDARESSGGALREFLQSKLPDYMVPSAFVFMERMPLTPNGKIDRRLLPEPERARPDMERPYVAPRTEDEEIVAGIWAHVLGVGRVGVDDNFFALGGHSILATKVISRVNESFGAALALGAMFETPTVAGLAAALRGARRPGGKESAPPVVRVSRDGNLPLSFAQQRLWFLNRLDPSNPAYNVPAAARLTGALDVAALEEALGEIVRRHEVLRTTYASLDGQVVQRVEPPAPLGLTVTDLRDLPPERREGEAARLAGEEARRLFDLQHGPLLRANLLRLGAEDHLLLLTMHHIASDGWSLGIFIREMAVLYESALEGRPAPLPELGIQYADFAAWQREWLRCESLENQLSYWRRQLSGSLPVLDLPAKGRPAKQGFRGETRRVTVPRALGEELRALSRREGVTLFMTLLAAFDALLYRYTGQTDIVVGTPAAGRGRLETEGLIGFFANTLVLRSDLSGEPSFAELLGRVRRVALEAYENQDVPFEHLVEALQPERNLTQTPLFQVMFAVQQTQDYALELPGLSIRPFAVDTSTAKFDLTLVVDETEDGLVASFEYNADVFDADTVERLSRHYARLLGAVAADASQSVARLPLLGDEEFRQIVFEWNDTAREYPSAACMHELFEAQAARAPGATALVFGKTELTYAELNERANRLAHHMRGSGVRPGDRVGVLMERSAEMLVAVIGVVKAGGVYVPLDPAWPAPRLHFILSSLGVECLLTQTAQMRAVHDLQWQLPRLKHVVCADADGPAPPAEPLDPAEVRALWDLIAERADGEVAAGGFVSSYTGEPFDEADVAEYRDRVVSMARPLVGPGGGVLEIGCGSGLIMYALAPQAGRYVGLDPSPATQERNRRAVAEKGLANVELLTGFAHEADSLVRGPLDLVVLASTAQFFPGPAYFTQVLEKALRLLAPGGHVLVADVMDARRKEEFRESLLGYRRDHPEANTKTQVDSELYFDEEFFSDLRAQLPELGSVSVARRERGFDNELGFRYDVLLRKADTAAAAADAAARPPAPRRKHVWTDWHLRRSPAHNPESGVTPDHLAYIIFTSGSTGVPKGVMVRHAAAVNIIDWVNRTFAVGPEDRLLFVTSLTFDLSVYDIFGTLAAGGSIHVASRAELRDPKRLVELMTHERITFWDSAPAALQLLAPYFPQAGAQGGASRLRLVFLSGDWIPLKLPDEVRAAFPGARVISLGGATEATVWSNFFPVGRVEPHWASVPYGKPIQNAQYHVLDAHLQPCPVDVPGDLYIGGVCLAVGYTDPELTASKFIPNPFARAPGARLYMTGDRSRYRAGGDLEFLGRADNQVKVRGYRIELGEIEAALGEYAEVSDAAAVVRDDGGERRLVGYVVARPGRTPTAGDLRAHLKQRLPEYMVPSAFVILDALPVTPNGKVDRRALPAPSHERPSIGEAFTAPRTPIEKKVASVWSNVLRVERVGVDDNFFALGGHSLLATQAVAQLSEAFGDELPLRLFFESPTVAGLAAAITDRQIRRADEETLAEALAQLKHMSPEEVSRLLAAEQG
ncbi:MAG TPA: amino acid adenylation domain-containing protein [Pyrinomonadaceae bacterium]|nr:amino acid adenylation domain-containing protein [Pyrinomonadaceae bacterium]